MKAQTKQFLILLSAVTVGVYLGVSLLPAIVPPAKFLGEG